MAAASSASSGATDLLERGGDRSTLALDDLCSRPPDSAPDVVSLFFLWTTWGAPMMELRWWSFLMVLRACLSAPPVALVSRRALSLKS